MTADRIQLREANTRIHDVIRHTDNLLYGAAQLSPAERHQLWERVSKLRQAATLLTDAICVEQA